MDLITITAIDKHSADTTSRTFVIENSTTLKQSIENWEKELEYSRYELITEEFLDEYDKDILNILDELEISN